MYANNGVKIWRKRCSLAFFAYICAILKPINIILL